MSSAYDRGPAPAAAAELERLVLEHADLVKRIAYHLVAKMPAHVDVDDLIQAGMIGLLNAAENYTADKGANFETYAGIRIRGAILDEARRANWTPRSAFRNARQLATATREIEAGTGREARPAEIAEALGVSLDDYHRMVEAAAAGRVLSIDQLLEEDESGGFAAESPDAGPLDQIEDEAFRDAVIEVIQGLPEREQLVLSLYYEQELNLREIGEVLGVTESRVCQIHAQAVSRIRARLADWTG